MGETTSATSASEALEPDCPDPWADYYARQRAEAPGWRDEANEWTESEVATMAGPVG